MLAPVSDITIKNSAPQTNFAARCHSLRSLIVTHAPTSHMAATHCSPIAPPHKMKTPSRFPLRYLCYLLLIPVLLFAAGCQSPVPANEFSAKLGADEVKWRNPKDFNATGVKITVAPNGERSFEIQSMGNVNNSNVIAAASAGRAEEMKAILEGADKLVNSGAALAGKAAAAALKP